MKHILFLILTLCLSFPALAQQRQFNYQKFEQDKCDFMVRELNLTAQDSARFLPIYREKLHAKGELFRRYSGNFAVTRKLRNNEAVADTTLLRVVNDNAMVEVLDAQLEQTYLQKLSKVLTPQQLYAYQRAEQKFKSQMSRGGRHAEGQKPQGEHGHHRR